MVLAGRGLFRGEVLRRQPQHLGLDAQQNIFGDQNDSVLPALKGLADLKHPAVIGGPWQPVGELDIHTVGLHPQPAATGEGNPGEKIALGPQGLQAADGLAGVGALFAVGAFQLVQLLQNSQGEHNGVVFKGFQRVRGLQEDAGVQYIGLFHGEMPAFLPEDFGKSAFIVRDRGAGFHPAFVKFAGNSGAAPGSEEKIQGAEGQHGGHGPIERPGVPAQKGLQQPASRRPGEKARSAEEGEDKGLYGEQGAAAGGQNIAGVDGDGVQNNFPVDKLEKKSAPKGRPGTDILCRGASKQVKGQPEEIEGAGEGEHLGQRGEQPLQLVTAQRTDRHHGKKAGDNPGQGGLPLDPALLPHGVERQDVVGARRKAGD